MTSSIEDLQMLRLIKAFQKIKNDDARRLVLRYVEEVALKDKSNDQETPPNDPPS